MDESDKNGLSVSVHVHNSEEAKLTMFNSSDGPLVAAVDLRDEATVFIRSGKHAQHIASLFAQAAAALTRAECEAAVDAKQAEEVTSDES